MMSTPSPGVTFYLLTEANNEHTRHKLNQTADQYKPCAGKRTPKGHPPIVHRSPLTLNINLQETFEEYHNKVESRPGHIRRHEVYYNTAEPLGAQYLSVLSSFTAITNTSISN